MKPLHRYLVIGVTVLALAAGVFVRPAQSEGWWDAIPLFWSVFGIAGCVVIIYVSKWLGTVLLQKKEEYYD